jgi:hypothetical protein
VNFVSFLGESFSEFGCHNTATPKRRVTYDANFDLVHVKRFSYWFLKCRESLSS